MSYLVESPQGEHAAIRKLQGLFCMLDGFFRALNLNPYYCWFLLEIQMDALVHSFKGDVDILIGRLHARNPKDFEAALAKYAKELPNAHPTWYDNLAALDIAESGGIEWPPKTDYLVGIETKCLKLDPNATEISEQSVKSRKSSRQAVRKIRLKIDRLLDMGFDKVALLEFIANPPASGVDSRAWSLASSIAFRSEQAVASVFKNRLLPDSLAGHWVCSVGSVAGGDETLRGSGGVTEYHSVSNNPYHDDPVRTGRRQEMEQNLRSILAGLPAPRSFPALFINCIPCGQIHRSYLDDACNAVYKADRHGVEEATLGS
ncbi:MAG: hypothetical protein ACXWID_09375 [Pyrinomonadaceae bacterium]